MTKTEYPKIGETLYEETLENGLKIFVIPKPGFSSHYASFSTRYGGAMRTFELNGETIQTPAGVAHFLEHKMFDLPDGGSAIEIFSSNGADPNAFTSSNVTCYYFKCTDNFEDNLNMLLNFVSTPFFSPETVAKEQGIIAQEIQMNEDNPASCLYYNFLGLLFDHHPIKDKILGSVESISRITADTLYGCHSVFYAPSNMILCVEGDVVPEQIVEIARTVLTSERKPVPHADYGEKEFLAPVCHESILTKEVSSPQFIIGGKVPFTVSPRERITGSLALKLMLGSSSSFFSRLYQEGIITNSLDSDVEYSAEIGFFAIDGEAPDPHRVLNEILDEAKRIVKEGFDQTYFDRCFKAIFGGMLRGLEDFDEVCLSLTFSEFDGYNFFDSFDELNNIKKEDCEKWIADNLTADRIAISIVSPAK